MANANLAHSAVRTDHSSPRLAPALVGRPGHQQRVWIDCPSWCVVDHVELHEFAVEDITHWSKLFGLQVASMLDPDTAHCEMFARINADPAHEDPRMQAAHVLVGNGSAEDAYLAPDMADEAGDDLIAFGMRLKEAARVARSATTLAEVA